MQKHDGGNHFTAMGIGGELTPMQLIPILEEALSKRLFIHPIKQIRIGCIGRCGRIPHMAGGDKIPAVIQNIAGGFGSHDGTAQ